MTRPVDRWDYDGDCPACFAGEPHSLEAHDAALLIEGEDGPVEEIHCGGILPPGWREARRFVEVK